MCFDFLYKLRLKHEKNGARYDKNVYWSSYKVHAVGLHVSYLLLVFM